MKKIAFKRFHSEPTQRKKSRWKRWLAMILIVICVGAMIYATNLSGYQIRNVAVEGAVLSDASTIKTIAEESVSGNYLFFIPRSFFWLYPKSAIRSNIEAMPSILGTDFGIDRDTGTMTISVKERGQKYLWCLPEKSQCFYMDERGLIFAPAPQIEGNIFLTFSGLLQGSAVGQYFLPDLQMQELLSFIEGMKALGLSAKEANAVSLSEIRIVLQGGAEVIISLEKPLSDVLNNLKILVASPDFTEASGGISKVKYIDLRYGTKAFWK